MDLFLCQWRASELRKVCRQEGPVNLMPRWSLCTWVQIAAQEVEGPLWHPSTQQ